MEEKVKIKQNIHIEVSDIIGRRIKQRKEKERVITGEAKESVGIGVLIAVLSSFSDDTIKQTSIF